MARKSPLTGRNSTLDAYTVKELQHLVRDHPDLGFTMKRVRMGEGMQSWFYAADRQGRKSRISREEAANLYVIFRMKRTNKANELAWRKEGPEELPWQESEGAESAGAAGIEEKVEDEPAEEKLFEVYPILGITEKRNGEGMVFIQDKQDGFRKGNGHNSPPNGGKNIFGVMAAYVKGLVKSNGSKEMEKEDFFPDHNRSNPQPVSREYVFDAVAAYTKYKKLIKSDRPEDLKEAVELARKYFPRPIAEEEEFQRKLFRIYGDNDDPSRLYEIEAGINPVDFRTSPLHASSDVERKLELERITRPLSPVEAAEFDREVRMEGLERLVRVKARV